jgi:hypothetical protein
MVLSAWPSSQTQHETASRDCGFRYGDFYPARSHGGRLEERPYIGAATAGLVDE